MNADKTFFLNVDTQKDFMNTDGLLYIEGAEHIKPILGKLTKYAKENGIKVVNTADWHYNSSKELSNQPDYINTFPPHCIANTPGVWYIDETTPSDDINVTFKWDVDSYSDIFLKNCIERIREIIITKDEFDVFSGNKHTERIIKELYNQGYTDIIVYGVSGDICVKKAIDGLLKRGFNVSLVDDATTPLSIDKYKILKEKWSSSINFKSITSSELFKN